MKTDRLHTAFAHYLEAIPTEFQPIVATIQPPNPMNERQYRKWRSRQMAHFLLGQLLIQHQYDLTLLQQINRTNSGRPYFRDCPLDFNISHSGEWVAVSLAPRPRIAVSVDIEQPKKIRPYTALLNHYASEQTIRQLNNFSYLPQLKNFTERFYLDWCLREAILKSQGVGIVKLSAVQHSVISQTIECQYCPKGLLYFYYQLPFYLATFSEQPQSMVSSSPQIIEWRANRFHSITHCTPIIYQVNP